MFRRWEYREYRRWRRHQRRKAIALVVVVFALVVAAAAHAGGAHTGHATTVRTGKHDRAHSDPRHAKAARRRNAARPGVAAAAAGLRWTNYHGIQLPRSASDGPHHVHGGLAWGFADTPGGALVAAINLGVRTAAVWGPAIYQPTIRHQVTGPDAAALLAADASYYAALRAASPVQPGRPAGRGYAAEAGYRFAAYTPAAATVDVVTEGPTAGGATVLAATRIEVVWRGGDWRVVAPPGGDWGHVATTVASLTGYTSFVNEG